MIGFWISLVCFALFSLFATEQLTKLFVQKKVNSWIFGQLQLQQKQVNRYQYFHYLGAGSFEKNKTTKKKKRRLLGYPISLLMYLQPTSDQEKKEIEWMFDQLYFKQLPEMKKNFFKALERLYAENRAITMKDIVKITFPKEKEQKMFEKMLKGTLDTPCLLLLFGLGSIQQIPLYHAPKKILALYFNPEEMQAITKYKKQYKERKNSKQAMQKLIQSHKKSFLFSANIIHHREKSSYVLVKHKQKEYATLLY